MTDFVSKYKTKSLGYAVRISAFETYFSIEISTSAKNFFPEKYWGRILSIGNAKEFVIPDCAFSSVGGEDDNRGNGGLQRPVQVGKTLDIQHVHLINEQNTWNQLSDALIYVFVHNFVDLLS